MESSHIIGLVTIILLFGGPSICGVVALIVKAWVKTARHRDDTDLKHRLVDAGFSVEEIERVMNAGRTIAENEGDGAESFPGSLTNMKIG